MFEVPRAGVSWCWSARAVSFLARAAMGACVSRREACPSASASPVASAIADFAAGARTERRDAGRDPAREGLDSPEGEGEGARASGSGSGSRDADADADAGALTASLLALKAARDGDDVVARREEEEEEDEWCSARSESSSKSWASDASSHPRDPAPRPDLAREQPRAPRPEHRADENVHPDLDQDDPHAEAWRELEVATAHLEADAVDRLAGESDGLDGPDRPHARSRDRSGGAFARLARVGEGMRVLRSVSRAARRAGGTLDLTSFAGTPIRWHAPHSALLTHARAESPLRVVAPRDRDRTAHGPLGSFGRRRGGVGDAPRRAARAVRLFAQLRESFGTRGSERRDGGRTTSASFPPDARTPEGRMLAIVRAILADAEPAAHLRKPFNPVLGETARHVLAFVDGDEVRSALEQVSHHPPITAFDSRGDGFAVFGHFRATPRLAGFRVEVDLAGVRYFVVDAPRGESVGRKSDDAETRAETDVGQKSDDARAETRKSDASETYASDYVGFEWHFMPRMRTCMSASKPYRVACDETRVAAEIRHVRGARVRGRVFRFRRRPIEPSDTETSDNIFVSDDGCVEETERLFDVSGRHDARVVARDARTGETGALYDASVAHAVETRCVASDEIFELSDDDKSSERTWGGVSAAMRSARWDAARRAKREVETRERVERRRRRQEGVAWRPRLFVRDERAKTWRLRD